ncbi:MAG: RecT family recombinase [Moraxella sp.]
MNEIISTNPTQPMNESLSQIMFNDGLFAKCERLAQIMASGSCTIPKHLQGKVGDCFAIIGQSLRWGMDPFAVAQKTHLVNGTLGYEAQLVIAVINARAPIVGRLKFDYFGDWSKVKSKDDKSDNVGVVVSAIMQGDTEPTTLSISMAQIGTVRNSPLWTADPRQQLAYLGAKRWARLYCPDVILGVYTPDELADRPSEPNLVAPEPAKNSGSQSIKERIKAKQRQTTEEVQAIECYDIKPVIKKIANATDLASIKDIGHEIKALKDDPNINLCGDDLEIMRIAYKSRCTFFELSDLIANITLDTAQVVRQALYDKQNDLTADEFEILDNNLDYQLHQLAGNH